ncbi:hypothetical protein BsWGS_00845 [Bradybaena similaris]
MKLIIFLSVCWVAHGQCPGLVVYDGDTKINTSLVCIKQYKKAACIDYFQSFNVSQLPQEFNISDFSVDRPNEIHVKGTENYRPAYDDMYPGLSIQWKPPFSGAGRNGCNGYLVAWFLLDGSVTMCQLFQIKPMINETLRFQYDVPAVSQQVQFNVRVYSLPRDGPQDKEDDRAFISTQITTPAAYKFGNPSEWAPFVAYDILNTGNGTVLVSVSLPPANYSLTEFSVYLQSNEAGSRVVDTKNYSAPLRTEKITEFSIPLTASKSGSYIIVVWVNDKFRYVDGQCQCWEWLNNERSCRNTCGGTRTPPFYVNITNPPPPPTVPPPPTTVPPPPVTTILTTTPVAQITTTPTPNPISTPENPNDVPEAIIAGVVVAVMVLVTLVILFCLYRNKSKVKYWLQRLRRRHFPNPDIKDPQFPEETSGVSSHRGTISRKTVYLISADDHEAHVDLIDALVSFLEVHCHCNVILPSHRDVYETGAYEWFLNSIGKSDFILFVNSEGALKMIEAHLEKKSYTNRKVGPEGDLFVFGLKHILCSVDVREKSLILVSFNGNHCQKFLQVPHVFKLPDHLRHLLQKIHRIDPSAISSYSDKLPLKEENIKELPEGAQMLSASKNVKIYEDSNPQWFENNFGSTQSLKPQYERALSIDSGITPDRLDSVSLQVSFPNSPTAEDALLLNQIHNLYPHGLAAVNDNIDWLSCYTIKEVRERMVEKNQKSGQDNISFMPPESASQIHCESVSNALANINKHADDKVMNIDEDSFPQTIIAPLNPLDIHVDSVSSALADINSTSYNKFFQGDQFEFVDEAIGSSVSQFDSVSL